MPFNSLGYLAFLSTAVMLFLAAPRRWRRSIVLLSSLAYYATWSPFAVAVPFAMAAFIRLLGRKMAARPSASRIWLWSGVTIILAALAFFKTASVLVALAPVGISFYSFEAISCLMDIRQRKLAEPRFLDILLLLLFWPTVISGPILRGRELFPQLKFDAPLDAGLFVSGLDRIVWGLVQKNVVANTFAPWVAAGFSGGHAIASTIDAWAVACAFGLQIYFDFCAYSNLAIGSAQLIGIRLPENFRYPYHASTPPEFWSRWHMSLSRWIRDYLFFPLNAKYRGAPGPLYASLIGVMALVGLWHGVGWGFLMWGALHGALLVAYRLYESFVGARHPAVLKSRGLQLGWRTLTLVSVTLAWVPFRAATVDQTLGIWRAMIVSAGGPPAFPALFYLATAGGVLFCVAEPFFVSWLHRADEAALEAGAALQVGSLAIRPLVYAAGVIVFLMFGGQAAEFIYFQF